MSATPHAGLGEGAQALRRRWRLVLLLVVLTIAAALAMSLSSAKEYDATAKLLLVQEDPAQALINPTASPATADATRNVNTGVQMVKLASIADAVRRQLGLPQSSAALLSQINVSADSTNSNIFTLTARDGSPRRAAAIANALANQYRGFRLASARQSFDQAAALAAAQLSALSPAARDSAAGRQLGARRQELQIDAALQTGGVQILSNASIPTSPSRPRPLLSAAIGLFLGILLGVGAALGLELLDRRLKDPAAIEKAYHLPVLGIIPRSTRRVGPQGDASQREVYGLIAANLRYAKVEPPLKVLMIASASPVEGKTTVTLGLARALTRLGLRVIAIEADLRRPKLAEYAGLDPTPGLSSLLTGGGSMHEELVWLSAETLQSVTLGDVKQHHAFAILPAGPGPANPQRALSRPAMADVIRKARTLSDIVLIDTAPIATVNDGLTLLRLVDQVLVVARLNRSTHDAVRRSAQVLQSLGVDIAGLVITDGNPTREQYAYYREKSPIRLQAPTDVAG